MVPESYRNQGPERRPRENDQLIPLTRGLRYATSDGDCAKAPECRDNSVNSAEIPGSHTRSSENVAEGEGFEPP